MMDEEGRERGETVWGGNNSFFIYKKPRPKKKNKKGDVRSSFLL